MVYRIRYRKADGFSAAEAVVEANSPTEAMVKFQHARDVAPADVCREVVTSVRVDDAPCSLDV